ncbi:hypothetical protein AKJ09_03490 [Labilithrix luteola]|uniref:Uncharacterized protein n=1 Tax=Labilithrix luteola TaxID=1391654 RepID=A0A0K1PTY8_9BACT|nr:hypothetical protein [Labilithrix luteola]AKU96826.1 hypothetical protein AKJ09_03490 [Labilithrix luteola]
MTRPAIPEAVTTPPPPLPPRIRRTLELVYGVEGVTAARVWHWPGRVSVGVRPAMLSAPSELLRRVESAVAGLREPDETWDFGLLDSD